MSERAALLKAERELIAARATLAEHVEENLSVHARCIELETRIDRARKILDEGRPVGSAESRLASDIRKVLGG